MTIILNKSLTKQTRNTFISESSIGRCRASDVKQHLDTCSHLMAKAKCSHSNGWFVCLCLQRAVSPGSVRATQSEELFICLGWSGRLARGPSWRHKRGSSAAEAELSTLQKWKADVENRRRCHRLTVPLEVGLFSSNNPAACVKNAISVSRRWWLRSKETIGALINRIHSQIYLKPRSSYISNRKRAIRRFGVTPKLGLELVLTILFYFPCCLSPNMSHVSPEHARGTRRRHTPSTVNVSRVTSEEHG